MPEPDDARRADILRVAENWSAAIVSNDAAQIAAFTADEWVMVSDTGVSPREDLLAAVDSGALTHSAMELVSDARIRCYGDTAVMTGRITNTAHFGGQQYDADEWTTDVFVWRDGRWLCVLTQITAARA